MITYKPFCLQDYANCSVVTDSTVANLYGITGGNVFLLPCGESAKCFDSVQALCSWFLSRNLSKDDTVVAIGGGSVGDMVGFAASIYKRGINLIHVPTTLLSQIDSSIGGKTAIDFEGVKNAIGTFHAADTVIDTQFLSTLDEEQLLSGYGELLKYRMLTEPVEDAYNGGQGDIKDIIRACATYKTILCDMDYFDRDARRMLNFGHTIGHAMELYYNLPHGVAVANGIFYETTVARKLNLCNEAYADKWTGEVCKQFEVYPLNDQVLELTLNDKKNGKSGVNLLLPESFVEVTLSLQELKQLLLQND